MSSGTLNEYWIRIGEVAEVLTHNLEVSDFSAMPGFSAQEVWENPFFLELANAYEQLEIDGLGKRGGSGAGSRPFNRRRKCASFWKPFFQRGWKR